MATPETTQAALTTYADHARAAMALLDNYITRAQPTNSEVHDLAKLSTALWTLLDASLALEKERRAAPKLD